MATIWTPTTGRVVGQASESPHGFRITASQSPSHDVRVAARPPCEAPWTGYVWTFNTPPSLWPRQRTRSH